ncbi:hypothetical protein HDU83_002349 [Entophlyctis luteolus]|nr:hypothetical protein HDU83_002349 [Entophlyctis luteolus]
MKERKATAKGDVLRTLRAPKSDTKLKPKGKRKTVTKPSLISFAPVTLRSAHIPDDLRLQLARATSAVLHARGATTTASARAAQEIADAAREATFPFLGSEDYEPHEHAAHATVYAATCILLAEAYILEADLLRASCPRLCLPSTCPEQGLCDHCQRGCKLALDALRAIDLGMLRGGVLEWGPIAQPLITRATQFQPPSMRTAQQAAQANDRRKRKTENISRPPQYLFDAGTREIQRVDARTISVEDFVAKFMNCDPPVPVVLTNVVDAWPAFEKWSDFDYIAQCAASRLVPVETCAESDAGRSFLSDSWSHRVMPLSEYLSKFFPRKESSGGNPKAIGSEKDEEGITAYLAQHPLFEQIPSLREDISIPPFCGATTMEDALAPSNTQIVAPPLASAWLGPAGTVSPLHSDPCHNLLAQVVGSKYVRLYDARDAGVLKPVRDPTKGLNATVDVDQDVWDAQRGCCKNPTETACLRNVRAWQTVLAAGEALYIPRLAWHYVRSLSPSFSVSLWWGPKMQLVERKGLWLAQFVPKDDHDGRLKIQ